MAFSVQYMLIKEDVPMTTVSDLYFVEGKYYQNQRDNNTWNLVAYTGTITNKEPVFGEPGAEGPSYYRKEIVDGTENGHYNVFYSNGELMEVGNWVDGKMDGTFHFFNKNGVRRMLIQYNMGMIVELNKY